MQQSNKWINEEVQSYGTRYCYNSMYAHKKTKCSSSSLQDQTAFSSGTRAGTDGSSAQSRTFLHLLFALHRRNECNLAHMQHTRRGRLRPYGVDCINDYTRYIQPRLVAWLSPSPANSSLLPYPSRRTHIRHSSTSIPSTRGHHTVVVIP